MKTVLKKIRSKLLSKICDDKKYAYHLKDTNTSKEFLKKFTDISKEYTKVNKKSSAIVRKFNDTNRSITENRIEKLDNAILEIELAQISKDNKEVAKLISKLSKTKF